MAKPILTAARAREFLQYDAETGDLRWRKAVGNRAKEGAIAGCRTVNGYLKLGFEGRPYFAHRVIWLMQCDEWPNVVDHIDGDGLNNRWGNLRSVSQSQNMQNLRGAHRDSLTGFLGVDWRADRKMFAAEILVDGKKKRLGYFTTAALAHDAYLAAKRSLHPACKI